MHRSLQAEQRTNQLKPEKRLGEQRQHKVWSSYLLPPKIPKYCTRLLQNSHSQPNVKTERLLPSGSGKSRASHSLQWGSPVAYSTGWPTTTNKGAWLRRNANRLPHGKLPGWAYRWVTGGLNRAPQNKPFCTGLTKKNIYPKAWLWRGSSFS